jgi:hypothetical protein
MFLVLNRPRPSPRLPRGLGPGHVQRCRGHAQWHEQGGIFAGIPQGTLVGVTHTVAAVSFGSPWVRCIRPGPPGGRIPG